MQCCGSLLANAPVRSVLRVSVPVPGTTSTARGTVVTETTVPRGWPAFTPLPADFFAALRFFDERARLRACAPLPVMVAPRFEIVAPQSALATVPPERVPKAPTPFLPILAEMLPWPPSAPRLRAVIVTLVLPLPRLALKLPETLTVPDPLTGSTAPAVIGRLRLLGVSFRPREPCSWMTTEPPLRVSGPACAVLERPSRATITSMSATRPRRPALPCLSLEVDIRFTLRGQLPSPARSVSHGPSPNAPVDCLFVYSIPL